MGIFYTDTPESQCRGFRVLDQAAVLHPEAADLGEVSTVSAVGCQELRHQGQGPRRINGEVLSRAVEVGVAQTESVESATVLIADAGYAQILVTAIRLTLAPLVALHGTRVRCEGRRLAVCLEDVHLSTASAILALWPHLLELPFRRRGCPHAPILRVGLPVDELHALWTLCVTVACAILGTSAVAATTFPSLGIHLHEVDGGVGAAREGGHVDVERELPVQKLEHLIGLVVLHYIDT
mmetsp:Transcript_29958/g.63754  ORF Transcript_29958/g.63754 Transcript_29958/m.63754 type:complete len:238 (-) Transcript_29958:461-1174(-)